MRNKMNAKRTLVSFLAIATLLVLATSLVSAFVVPTTIDGFDVTEVTVDGITLLPGSDLASVTAGETITIKVYFTADLLTGYYDATTDGIDNDGDGMIDAADVTGTPVGNVDESAYSHNIYDESASNVRIRAELQGAEGDSSTTISGLVVGNGHSYVETLTLEVPEVDDDELSEDMTLTLKIWNSDFETELEDDQLRVQRESFEVSVRSVFVSNTVEAGQRVPVQVVLENTGYNDLEDLYVTVSIPELGIETRAYFGDLAVEGDHHHHDDDDDSVTVYLDVPYTVASGLYTLEVEVANEDFSSNFVEKQVAVTNGFPEVVMASGDNLLILNPTNNLKVYKVVYPSADLTVPVQAGSSKLISIDTPEGEYSFDVFVFDGDQLVGTVNYSGVSESETLASPVVVLTVILAVIFVVLLIVMIVLMTKKPEKSEEFGESYY
jgi:hypothetical protein